MSKDVFQFDDYKAYIKGIAGTRQRKGVRQAMAAAIRCQPGYISQVLNGDSQFSLEQAERLNKFFLHSKDERHYFLLLVQKARAGTAELTEYFSSQLAELKQKRLVVTSRLGQGHQLTELERAKYYSSWLYAAAHIGLSIPALQDKRKLAEFLQTSPKKVTEIIDFLLEAGLVISRPEGGYQIGPSQVRIGNDSHHIIKHHTNWRNRAIESLEREGLNDLHYSGVFSISKRDLARVKDVLLKAIESSLGVIRESPEEELICLNMDFFHLRVNVNLES